MNNFYQLFFTRLKKGWQYQFAVCKLTVDWTVWLYIVIPTLIFLSNQYYLLVMGASEWVQFLSLEFSWIILFFLCWTGALRLFVEGGDLLFIRQQQEWIKGIMHLGIAYSAVKNTVFILVVFVLMTPYWFLYEGVSISKLCILIVFIWIFRFSIQFMRQMIEVTFQNWKGLLVNSVLFIITAIVFAIFIFITKILQLAILICCLIILVLLYKKRIDTTWCFYEDCAREVNQRLKLTNLLIQTAIGTKIEKRHLKRKKPFILFPNSYHLFKKRTKENIITEIYVKFLFRNKSRLYLILKMVGLFTFALTIAPFWIKWLLLGVCILIVIHILQTVWKELKDHPFFKLYTFEDDDAIAFAVKRGISIFSIPISFQFGLVTGTTAFSITIGLVTAFIVSFLVYYYIRTQLWLA